MFLLGLYNVTCMSAYRADHLTPWKTTTDQNIDLWSPVTMDASSKHFCIKGSGDIVEQGAER